MSRTMKPRSYSKKSIFALLPLLMTLMPATIFASGPKFCTKTNSNGVTCKVSVRIICTMDNFLDSKGNPVSCTNPDQDNEMPYALVQNPAPSKNYCGSKDVTIAFKVCNRNNKPIRINDQTWVKYNGVKQKWDDNQLWINKNQCKTFKLQDKWDPCVMARDGRKASKYMETQISARVVGNQDDWSNNGQNAFCYCHLFKAARAEFDNPPAPTEKCTDAQNFRITEIVHGQYVELLNKDCAKKEIVDELYLVRIPHGSNKIALNSKGTFFKDAYSLQKATGGSNSLLPDDGFLLACHNANTRFRSENISCDSGSDDKEFFPLIDGKDTYLLVKIENGDINDYTIIDIYGSTLSYTSRSSQNLSNNGRAQRHTDISMGFSQFWQPNEWYIRKNNAISLMDPREWQNAPEDPIPFVITEITNPVPANGAMPPKYIEIYTDSGKGGRVNQPIQLVIFHDSGNVNEVVPANVIDLQGRLIPSDGYMLFCNPAAAGQYGERACDFEFKDSLSPVSTNGDDNFALIRGDLMGGKYEVLDIFGRIGEDGTGTDHEFYNARVVRDIGSIFQNNGVYIEEDWCILPYDSQQSLNKVDPADPRKWVTRCNTPAPTPLPTFAPSHGPSTKPSITLFPTTSPSIFPTTSLHPSYVPSDRPSHSQAPSIMPTDAATAPPTTLLTKPITTGPTASPVFSRLEKPAPPLVTGKSKGKGKAKTKGKGKAKGEPKIESKGKGKSPKYNNVRRRRTV